MALVNAGAGVRRGQGPFRLPEGAAQNISNYPVGHRWSWRAQGETAIGVSFMHDVPGEQKNGFPVAMAAPCEGTGYEVGRCRSSRAHAIWRTRKKVL